MNFGLTYLTAILRSPISTFLEANAPVVAAPVALPPRERRRRWPPRMTPRRPPPPSPWMTQRPVRSPPPPFVASG
ncbi:hypothetical protein BRADI_1g47857v3 [Brachypodium distachyon]|uniref:Uncharacterized protein n=1 Tax=Brachypodium distachyon TaxID=15368 RepID=A0A2K2DQ40_BRADI|nr:hypothetical protein BRADI_1g47857v3 [Brachypodium distachyon]